MANSWQLESGQEYDPEKFYTRSKDKQGHSSTLRINLPDYLMANLAELVQSKAIPAYRTREDFVRDAIVHRYAWVVDQLQNTTLATHFEAERQRLNIIEDAARRLAESEENSQLLESLRTVCDRYMADRSWDLLKDYLQLQEETVNLLPRAYQDTFRNLCTQYWSVLPEAFKMHEQLWGN